MQPFNIILNVSQTEVFLVDLLLTTLIARNGKIASFLGSAAIRSLGFAKICPYVNGGF